MSLYKSLITQFIDSYVLRSASIGIISPARFVNVLWLSDAIRRHSPSSSLIRAMASVAWRQAIIWTNAGLISVENVIFLWVTSAKVICQNHRLTHCGRHRSVWTLAKLMACCLTTPSHYLNQCWLIGEYVWQSPHGECLSNYSAYWAWKYKLLPHLPGTNECSVAQRLKARPYD